MGGMNSCVSWSLTARSRDQTRAREFVARGANHYTTEEGTVGGYN